MATRETTYGFVLAGGFGSRMGRDKALLEWDGQIFLERTVETLSAVAIDVCVVTRPGKFYEGFHCIADLIPGLGPLGGIWTALEHLEGKGCWILGCDLPLIDFRLFRLMERRIEDYDLIYPTDRSGIPQLLAAYYSRNCLPVIREMIGARERRLRGLLRREELSSMALHPDQHGFSDTIFTNVNTANDLARLSP